MNTSLLKSVVIALSLGLSSAAHADVIIETTSFVPMLGMSLSGTLQPFNPALGTLDRVDVSIVGGLALTSLTQENCDPEGQGCTPLPYPYIVSLDQQIRGAQAGQFFDFGVPEAGFLFSGVAPGDGGLVVDVRAFSYDFHFDQITDLVGFTLASTTGVQVAPLVSGTRAGFLPDAGILDMLAVTTTLSGLLPSYGATPISLTGEALLRFEYTYTPPSVPAPWSVSLVAAGIALLVGRARLRSRRSRATRPSPRS